MLTFVVAASCRNVMISGRKFDDCYHLSKIGLTFEPERKYCNSRHGDLVKYLDIYFGFSTNQKGNKYA